VAGSPPWWADWVKSVSLVISGGGLTVLGNWFTPRWTLTRERKRAEEEALLKRDIAWAELQQDSLLQAQAALQEYLTSHIAMLAERAGRKTLGGDPSRLTEASHTLIVTTARLDDRDLAERIEAWRSEFFNAIYEAGKTRQGFSDEPLKAFADRADDLSRELGAQAREVFHRSVRRPEQSVSQAELDAETGMPEIKGSDG
jgi:hypothetical protein